MFKNRTVLFAEICTIWENMDGCAEQYRCITALYVLSMLEHAYNIIIDCVVGPPVHGREVVDVFNDTEKCLFSMLMANVQLYGAAAYDL